MRPDPIAPSSCSAILPGVDEVLLAERLIGYDTSHRDGIAPCTDFVAGWLEARGAAVQHVETAGRRCLLARVGAGEGRMIWHGHLDVVPGFPEQFRPRVENGRLIGRGAYDMKAALAAMMLAGAPRPDLIVPVGLCAFGVLFAVNSSVHSYLVLAYAGSETAAEDVGFYYAANAAGRFGGTLLSGLLYGWGGLAACLAAAAAMLALCWAVTLALPARR